MAVSAFFCIADGVGHMSTHAKVSLLEHFLNCPLLHIDLAYCQCSHLCTDIKYQISNILHVLKSNYVDHLFQFCMWYDFYLWAKIVAGELHEQTFCFLLCHLSGGFLGHLNFLQPDLSSSLSDFSNNMWNLPSDCEMSQGSSHHNTWSHWISRDKGNKWKVWGGFFPQMSIWLCFKQNKYSSLRLWWR